MDGVGHAVAHEYLPARRAMEKSPRKPAGKTAFIVAASWLHEETAYAGKLLLLPFNSRTRVYAPTVRRELISRTPP